MCEEEEEEEEEGGVMLNFIRVVFLVCLCDMMHGIMRADRLGEVSKH